MLLKKSCSSSSMLLGWDWTIPNLLQPCTEYGVPTLPSPLMLLEFVLNTLYVVNDTIHSVESFPIHLSSSIYKIKIYKKTNQHFYARYTLSGLVMEFSLIMVFLINFVNLLCVMYQVINGINHRNPIVGIAFTNLIAPGINHHLVSFLYPTPYNSKGCWCWRVVIYIS